MKKITSAMIRVARMGVSLVLCLSMLCSNLLPIASLAQEQTETYYSPEYALNGIVPASEGKISTPQNLVDWCETATVDLYYQETKLVTGDTVPRGATVTLQLNVALKNTLIKECDQDATFTYTIPSSVPVGNISTMPFYDPGSGEHLMNWWITNNVLTIQFTERFYADQGRNNVKCFVTAEGVLSSDVINNGQGTYSFTGGSSYTFNFPVGTVTATKTNHTVASTAFNATTGKLIGTYSILINAEDNLDQVVITDLPGSFLTVIPTSYDLRSGSRTGSSANSQMSVGADGKITITNLVAKTNYYLNYQVEVSLDALGSGYLESTDTEHLPDRQNSASVEWTRGSETGTVSAGTATFNYASTNLVSVSKTYSTGYTNYIPDANGKISFAITVTPQVALTQLVVKDLPGLYWQGGTLTSTTAGVDVVIDSDGTITIANAVAKKSYTFTYVVDYPYEAAAANLLYTATAAERTNTVSAAGYLGTTKIFERTAQATSPATSFPFSIPTKTITKSVYVSDDGRFLVDFTVTIPRVSSSGSAYQNVFKTVFVEDTLGDYFTLAKDSVKVGGVAVPEADITVTGQDFKFQIPNYNSYNAQTITYTVEVDRTAVLTGLLKTGTLAAPRTNTVKYTWESPNGKKGSSPERSVEVAYNVDIAPTITKAYTANAVQYDPVKGYYVNFIITFSVPENLEYLSITDTPGQMFAQSYAGSDWKSQIQIKNGTNDYIGDSRDSYTYRLYEFYNIPAGTYTITYPAKVDFVANGYNYDQIRGLTSHRVNTAKLAYTKDGSEKTVSASSAAVTTNAITFTKTGAVQKDEDGNPQMYVIDGVNYMLVYWTITLTSTGTNMAGGTLTDSLFGRQCFAANSTALLDSFLTVYEGSTPKGYGLPSSTNSNTVGSQSFLQEFTYQLGSIGESTTATTKSYRFQSFVREPNVPTTITASNQAVFEHPLWGRYVATAEVDTIWTTVGTIAPATISKSLISVDTTTNASTATARWKSTIHVPQGTTVTNGLFTDYMNFAKPASYFDITKLNLSVAYADGTLPAPAYEQTIAADSGGIDHLSIKFTEPLTKSVVITYTTSYDSIDSAATAKKFINFSDFEYAVSELGGAGFYVSDQDYWSMGRTEFTKTSSEPRYDETLNQYVIDWEIVLDDALRVGMLTKVTDTLPTGLTLVAGSVQASPISGTVAVTGTSTVPIIAFTPMERETKVTLTTAIGAAYLHGSRTFTNKAALWNRAGTSNNYANASADATFENLRTFSKTASEPAYNSLTDQYEITWTIALNDKTSKTIDVYLKDRLPEGVTYVEGSIAVTPNRLNQMEMAGDGKSFIISLNPGNSDDVVITFKTTINDDKLYQDAGIVDFKNYVDLLAADKTTVLQTADATTHIATNAREFTKSGYAHYDQAEEKFVVDWVITLNDQARAGRQVILAETLPAGLTLGSVVVRTDDGGAILPHQIQNVSGNGRTFEILYTSPITRSTIYLRTYVDEGQLDGTVPTRTYLNTVNLMTADGRKIDTTNATVSISTAKSFQKSFDKVVYDEVLGKYVIHWNLDVSADLFTNVPLIVEDTLPAGLSLVPANAVTCTDTEQPTALTYSQTGQVVKINLTPLQGVTHLVLRTAIDMDHLIYTGATMPKYTNTAKVVTAAKPEENLGLSSSAECNFGLKSSDMLTKTGRQITDSNRVVYTVEVNKPGIDLANGAAEIILSDTLNVSVTMLMDQVRVYNGTTGLRIPAQDYQVQYETSTRLLTFRLPNRQYLKVEFEVLLNGNPKDDVTLDNTIKLMGDLPLETSTGPLEFHVQEPTAGVSYDSDHVKIHKFDRSDTSKNLAGASFILYRVTDLTTGAAELVPIPAGAPTQTNSIGILHLPSADSSLVVNTLYYVVETGAPDGYLADTTKYYFFIPGSNGAEAQEALNEVTNAGYRNVTVSTAPQLEISNVIDLKTRVVVNKVFTNGSGQQEMLSGAKLEIWDETRANKIYSFTSGSVKTVLDNLKESGADLQIGKTYWLVEAEAPAGYKVAAPADFELTSQVVEHGGKDITVGYAEVTMEDDPTQVAFRKEGHKGKLIAGASLQIIDESGSVVTSFTSTEAVHTVNSLSYGTVYGLREITAPDGYLKTDAVIWFKLLADGTVASVAGTAVAPVGYNWPTSGADVAVTLKNDPRLLISKLDDTADTEPVIGAELELYAGTTAAGQPILTWITDGTPYMVEGNLAAGSYTLHEKTVPKGYELAADQTFNVTGNETSTIHITMTDPKITTTSLSGTKQWFDYDGITAIDPAQDVTIQLYRSDDPTKTLATQELKAATKDTDYSFTGLEIVLDNNGDPYTYHVREVPVPGYFSEVVTGGIANYKTRVTIQKQNEASEQLSGARFQLKNQSGATVKEWVTGATPTVFTDVIGGTYTLHEVTPPDGYATMSPNPRSIVIKGDTLVTVKDPSLNVKIEKVDENGNGIAGAALQLFEGATATGTPYLSWTSTTDAYVPTLPLKAGATYTLHEATAPEGYLIAEDFPFVVKDEAKEQMITMADAPIVKTSLTVIKEWDDDNNRDQKRPTEVDVTLYANGDAIETVKLDAGNSWTYTWPNLYSTNDYNQPTTYTVDETAVPAGYSKSIVVDPQDATKVTITNSYMPAKRDVTVQKKWNDNDNVKGTRPTAITVELLEGATATGKTAELNVGNNWTYTWQNLPVNSAGVAINYTVKEVTVPAGYVSQIAEDDQTKTIIVTNTYANVVINKYRAAIDGTASTTPLGGAKFEVLSQDKSSVIVPAFTMSAGGSYTLSGNLAPGSYWLRETFTPAGHYKADDVAFTVSGNDLPVNIYDKSTVVAIRKLDEGNANLPGAKLGIYSATDTELLTFTTTAATQVFAKDGVQVGSYTDLPAGTVVIEGILEAGQQYTLKELTVPGTYLKADGVPVTVNSDSKITNVTMVDKKIELISVQVTKVWNDLGITGITHPTVTIDLFRSDDLTNPHRTDTLANGVTTLTFSGLEKTNELGALYTYTVKERPVAGYISAVNGFTITNTRTNVSIKKLAGNTEALVPGAQLQIMSADGTQPVYGPFTTTSNATNLTGILTGGTTYQLKEVGLPAGFVQADPVTFTVDQATIKVEMIDKPTVVLIQKINTSGKLIPGATLEIRDGGTTVKTLVTDNTVQVISWNNQPIGDYASLNPQSGSILLEGILESGKTYQLVETQVPSGYKLADPESFTVNATGSVTPVSMTDPTDDDSYEVLIKKLDQYGDPVVGARLQLKNTQTDSVIATWTTTDEPYRISLPSSLDEIYELSELNAPEGYTAAAKVTFAVHRDAQSVKVGITMIDVLVDRNVHGTKTWVDRGLTGAHKDIVIELYRDGTLYDTKTLTNGTTTYSFLNLPAVDANNKKYVYTVKERVVDGYATTQTGNDFTNTATQVTIRKVDEQDVLVPGVVLVIYDQNNNEIIRWNTADLNGNPKVLVGVLNANANYTLVEETAPMGYVKAANMPFSVDAEGSVQTVTMTNARIPWKVTIGKVAKLAGADTFLPNAVLSVFDTTNLVTPVKSWNTSETNPMVITDLDPTKSYVLKETATPAGFVTAADVPFDVTMISNGEYTITMTNLQTAVNVEKRLGTAPLAGAWMEIRDANGTPVRRWLSNGSVKEILGLEAGKTYTLHEILPPVGYATNPFAIQFQVSADGIFKILGTVANTRTTVPRESLTEIGNPSAYQSFHNSASDYLIITDDLLDIKIKKVDENGNGIAGAALQLFEGANATGTPYLSWTSTTDAYVPTKPLEAGATYTLHEATAPEGYLLAEDFTFVVEDIAKEQMITMEDALIVKTSLTVTKAWEDDNNRDQKRPTEVYVELRADGVLQGTAVKLDAGNSWRHTFSNLLSTTPGKQEIAYSVDETAVPAGYSKSIVVDPQDATKVTITNSYMPAKRDVTVQKVWNDNTDIKLARPASITVALLADNVDTGYTATLNVANSWRHTWPDLPTNNAGVEIQYTVKEVTVPAGYVSEIVVNPATKLITVTNTYANVVINKYRAAIDGTKSTTPLGGAKFEVLSQDKSSVIVPAFTMSAGGSYTLSGNLAPGSYWLRETFTPAGHYKTDDVAFTVSGNDQPVSIYDKSTVVAIRKLDEGNANLPGAKLGIYSATDTELLTFTTTAATQVFAKDGVQVGSYTDLPAGTVVIEGILEVGQQYTLKELTVPGTYLKADDVPVTVNSDSTITNVTMVDKKIELISVQVTKVWDDLGVTGITHPTVTIDLFRSDDLTNPHRTDTLANGVTTLTFSGLEKTNELGALYTYTVKERPVAGYISAVNGFTITNTRTKVSIKKLAGNTEALVPGAQLQIMSADGMQPVYGPFTTTSSATNLTGILSVGTTYQLKEVGLPTGFVQANPVTFTVDRAAIEVQMIDQPTIVVIRKMNTSGTLLPGATLEIRDGGTTVKTLVTGNTTQVISWNNQPMGDYASLGLAPGSILLEGILESGKTYQLVETDPPTGYKSADPESFTVGTTGAVKYVSMTDPTDDGHYEVTIKKLDQYGDPVVGAQLQLKNTQTNAVIETWTTTELPKAFSLPASLAEIYELSELNAPEGYTAAAKMTFAVHRDAQSVKVGITMIDVLVDRNIHGTKTWVDRSLTGAHKDIVIELYRDGNLYLTKTLTNGTTTYDFLNLPAVDAMNKKYVYTVKERAVNGYGTVQTGSDFTNTATQVTIRKVDENGDFLPDVVLAINDQNNNEIIRWNTSDADGNPKVLVGVLNANTNYTLVEVTEPMGYAKAANIPFLVNADGSVQTLTMTNKKTPWAVTIRKVARLNGTDVLLPNVVLSVFDTTNLVTPVKSWNTSVTNPMVITDLDPTKHYVLKETSTPAGFIPAADVLFDVTLSTDNQQTITMTNLQTAVYAEKLLGNTHLAGAWMEIRDENGTPVRRWLSTGSAKEILGLEIGKTYTLHEILPPAGYVTNPYGVKFQVFAEGKFVNMGTVANTRTTVARENIAAIGDPSAYQGYHNSESVKLSIIDDPLDIKISKVDAITASGLAGATLELYKGTPLTAANLVERWVSTASPHTINVKLEAGMTYILHEAEAPVGYQSAPDMQVSIDDVVTTQLFTMTDTKNKVTIEKRDALNGNFVLGAQLTLVDNVTQSTVATWTTDGAPKVFEGVLVSGRSYTLSETIVPINHYRADPITFTVQAQGENPAIVMIDSPMVVTVSKQNEEGALLGGARLALYAGSQGTGTQLEAWDTTTDNPRKLTTQLVEGQTYSVREVAPPNGYYTSPDLVFTVEVQRNPDGSAKDIVLVMENYESRVAIWMYDQQTDWMLSGASLVIKDANGNVVDSWISGSTQHIVQNLIEGQTYTLTQTAAPEGFAIASPITFTVPVKPTSSTEDVTFDGNKPVYNVKMYDPHIYKFLKVDYETGEPLPGAMLDIRDDFNRLYDSWISTTVPHELIGTLKPGTTYTLNERKAPVGYEIAFRVRFTVELDGTLKLVEMSDRRIVTPTAAPDNQPISIPVTKVWQDDNNQARKRPSSITINLYQKARTEASYPSTPFMTATMNGTGNTWSYTFRDLPRDFDYLVQESAVSGYNVSYANNGHTITNWLAGMQPTPTPFATPTAPIDDGGLTNRTPVGMRFVDGEWLYIDEYDTPLGVVPLTGDDSNWPLWIAATLIPMLGILIAVLETRRRSKKRRTDKASSAS